MEDKIYKTGRIYKLYSHINEIYYIGSTHNTLRHRLYGHKSFSNRVNKKVSDWIEDIGVDNLQIEELHKYEDLTAKQLRTHEDNVIREHLGKEHCLNCRRVYLTEEEKKEYEKQYYEENKDQILQQKKQYREDNKEQIAEKSKLYREANKDKIVKRDKQYYEANKEKIAEKITCPICNTEVRRSGFARHEKTKKHKLNLLEVKTI